MVNADLNPSDAMLLVVDDDDTTRRMISIVLNREGWRVIEARDGEEALRSFQELHPDLVLLDVLMPRMDGYETCSRLKALPHGPETPVLLVTALDDPTAIRRAYSIGAEDFITKPIQWEVVRHRIRRLLQLQGLRRAMARQKVANEQQQRYSVEKLMMTISTQFIDVGPDEVDVRINDSLKKLSEAIGADRSYMFVFSPNELQMDNTHEWCSQDIAPQRDALHGIPIMLFPWWYDKLTKLETIFLSSPNALPSEARTEHKFLEARRVKSLIILPIGWKGRLAGFLGFDSVHTEQIWTDEVAALLKIAGEVFIAALEHKNTEEALHFNERELRQLTDTMLDAVYRTNADGVIEFASSSCWQIFGFPPANLIGKSVFENVHPDDLELMRMGTLNTGSAEYRFQHASGEYIWVETLSNLIFGDNSQIEGIVFASRDITQRKRAERELQELNRLKTEFLSTAAHELRTPLTTIRGFSEILLNRQYDHDRQLRYLRMINEQATHLGKIIDDLLDISRLEAKRMMTLTLDAVEIGALVERVMAPYRETSTKHKFSLQTSPDCLPILGDSMRLSQVMQNLLSNAMKYSPKGGDIRVKVEPNGRLVQISVEDNGIGMTPEQQAHLFEKFYRADASNTATTGTGLGLAISKLIIELHGGKIWAKSVAGEGSVFYFTLPTIQPAGTSHDGLHYDAQVFSPGGSDEENSDRG